MIDRTALFRKSTVAFMNTRMLFLCMSYTFFRFMLLLLYYNIQVNQSFWENTIIKSHQVYGMRLILLSEWICCMVKNIVNCHNFAKPWLKRIFMVKIFVIIFYEWNIMEGFAELRIFWSVVKSFDEVDVFGELFEVFSVLFC